MPYVGAGLSEREERATLERLGIDPDLSRRHLLRKLYPFVRGLEKASEAQVDNLVVGALQRYHAQFAAEDRRRARLRRWAPLIALVVVLLLLLFGLVLFPDLVLLRRA